MNDIHLDILSRRLALATSRRGSLLTVGGGGLAALSSLSLAAAAKNNKMKRRKKKRKKDKNKNSDAGLCQAQEEQCNGIFASLCTDEDAPEDCLEQTGICCDFLGECQAEEFIECFLELLGIPIETLPPV